MQSISKLAKQEMAKFASATQMGKKAQVANLSSLISVIIILSVISVVSGVTLIVNDQFIRMPGLNQSTIAAVNASAAQIASINTQWLGIIVIVIVMVIILVLLVGVLRVFSGMNQR